MNVLTIIILAFSVIGGLDYIFGSKLGLGKEFEKGFSLFGPMSLSMLGMLVLAPAFGVWLSPVFEGFYNLFKIDPSVIPASLFANDMGGTQLAQTLRKSESIGNYNAFIISAMMGCTISFTIPVSMGLVKKEKHKELFFGLLCGIVTIPIGCLVSGLICKINIIALLTNLIPLVIVSIILALLLIFLPNFSVKCFSVFGFIIKAVAIIGLALSIFTLLTNITISEHFGTFKDAAFICANACVTLSGALPLMFVVSKLLKKPLSKFGKKLNVNETSTVSFLGTMVTNVSTFGVMNDMDKKGTVLNSAFAVSAAFTFGGHLAFTMAFDSSFIAPMIIGKIISGICAVILAGLLYKDK
ncbi:MAG: ethanolamine utilization protein EutH [Clostridia bacterium]|nr:ethanolamine utilization protein EutH [Clostridia bacterium]